jgi:hypothetical protein
MVCLLSCVVAEASFPAAYLEDADQHSCIGFLVAMCTAEQVELLVALVSFLYWQRAGKLVLRSRACRSCLAGQSLATPCAYAGSLTGKMTT